MPANSRRGRPQGKCHRKQTAIPHGKPSATARVKRCGKSAPRPWQQGRQGKPHREQDRIGAVGRARKRRGRGHSRPAARVGRVRRAVTCVPEEWLLIARWRPHQARTEPGLQAVWIPNPLVIQQKCGAGPAWAGQPRGRAPAGCAAPKLSDTTHRLIHKNKQRNEAHLTILSTASAPKYQLIDFAWFISPIQSSSHAKSFDTHAFP